MKNDEEEVLVGILIIIGSATLIYFHVIIGDALNAIWAFLCGVLKRCYNALTLPQQQQQQRQRQNPTWREPGTEMDKLIEEERNRIRENAPDMPTDCPVCLEPLFDSKGIADKDIAIGLGCVHVIHSDCLEPTKQALNADGKRYGNSVFGPRSGCPSCGTPVTFWFTTKKATDFSVFWMHLIQKCVEQVGRENGPVSVEVVMKMLRSDPSLTKKQKKLIVRAPPEENGGFDRDKYVFEKALDDGDSLAYTKKFTTAGGETCEVTGGWNQFWDYDSEQGTLWMKKWSR